MSEPLPIRENLVIPSGDLSWDAVRSSGPGGQNVNKVASKVELRFAVHDCVVLDEISKRRLCTFAKGKLDAEGRVLIVSQLTRDQRKNLEDARSKLRDLILIALSRPKPRRPSRPTRASRERRLTEKKKQGDKKRMRVRADP